MLTIIHVVCCCFRGLRCQGLLVRLAGFWDNTACSSVGRISARISNITPSADTRSLAVLGLAQQSAGMAVMCNCMQETYQHNFAELPVQLQVPRPQTLNVAGTAAVIAGSLIAWQSKYCRPCLSVRDVIKLLCCSAIGAGAWTRAVQLRTNCHAPLPHIGT